MARFSADPKNIVIIEKPFQILVWKDFLPAAKYAALDSTWPSRDKFSASTSPAGKWDIRGEDYERVLSPEWLSFVLNDRLLLTQEVLQMMNAEHLLGHPNRGRFMERSPGYVLDRHLDLPSYTCTFLVYLPLKSQIEQEGAGTIIYPRGKKAFEIPYTPNTLVAFPNTPKAWHGLIVPPGENRRIYQWHLSTKETNFGL